ncbi:MAG: SpoIIE family protein phosphatase [Bacteroidetes bacterium]|nr:SpoIIE family protein phosphatase [Bacteroidota bacterium]
MEKTEKRFGIIAIIVLALGVIFKFQHWPGASILFILSVFFFNLIYLPVNLILGIRKATSFPGKAYVLIKFLTLFINVTAFCFKMMHWPGGGFLLKLGVPSIALLIISYFILRKSGKGIIPFNLNDLILTALAFLIFIFINRVMVSPDIVNGYSYLNSQYEKLNSGIHAANNVIYRSVYQENNLRDIQIVKSIKKLEIESNKLYDLIDSLKNEFTFFYSGYSYERIKKQSYIISDKKTDNQIGRRFFIEAGNGKNLKDSLNNYVEIINFIISKHNIQSTLIGFGLDTKNIENEFGYEVSWESYMFKHIPVAAVYANLSRLENLVLITESNTLNALINQFDLSEESLLLQEFAKKESERAIDEKQEEITRIKQAEKLRELELAKSKSELNQRTTLLVFALVGVAFVLVLLIISTRAFVIKQKANKKLAKQKNEILEINEDLKQANEEISSQRDEIEAQRDMVMKQKEEIVYINEELTDSIHYAKYIQNAILPQDEYIKKLFPESFILFKPKNIVSGDFYWLTELEGRTIIAAADCTGHGVPGAFMSMLGVSFLNDIINKEYITHPGVILRRLRKEVINALQQKGEYGEQRDGMDIALCSIDFENLSLQFSGANNPLYIIRSNEHEPVNNAKVLEGSKVNLYEIKGDKMPVAFHERMEKYEMYEINLYKGDCLYMFSDGFADQFGGEHGKKFKYRPFKDLLLKNHDSSMSEQYQILDKSLKVWQGNYDQVDDILVIGVRV